VAVNRSHGVNGAVARASVVALSASTIAAPPERSADPQKPWNSKCSATRCTLMVSEPSVVLAETDLD
jgi:hypothetical protein